MHKLVLLNIKEFKFLFICVGHWDTGQKQFPLSSLSKTDQQILLENKMTLGRSESIKELEKRFDLLP